LLQIKSKANKDVEAPSRAVWRRAQRFGLSGLLFFAAAWWLNATVGADPLAESVKRSQPGRVERVVDGDTLRFVQPDGSRSTLRLLGVDAPESGQAGGAEAREFVAGRVCGVEVTVRRHGEDRYGRTVASVEVAGADLSVSLVRNGLAWRVKRYLETAPADLRDAYEAAWREARDGQVGMWAGDPQPPWEWRRTNQPAKGQGIDCADRH